MYGMKAEEKYFYEYCFIVLPNSRQPVRELFF